MVVSLQGFEAVNPVATSGKAVLTVTPTYMRFNKSTAQELGNPDHIKLLVNPATKQFAVQACSADAPNAIAFSKDVEVDPASVTLRNPIVVDALARFFQFEQVPDDMVAYAQLKESPLSDESTLVFDVASARLGTMKKRGRKKQCNTVPDTSEKSW